MNINDVMTEELAPRRIVTDVSGFYPVFEVMLGSYDLITAAVFGVRWRYCQMEDGVCRASLETIAKALGVDRATVMRKTEILVADGYLKDLTPDLRNRPHVYADGGLIVMKSKMTVAHSNTVSAAVAHSNAAVAQCNVGVAQSYLNKDSNKDFNKVQEEPSTASVNLAEIARTYESEIGILTAMIAEELDDAEKTYPKDWILDAIREAAGQNKRNWKYCLAILRRWKAQGNQSPATGVKPTASARPTSSAPRAASAIQSWLEKQDAANV